MEALIREIEARQHAVQAGQTAFRWASGIIAAFVIAVIAGLVGIDLSRIFVLGDRIAAVDRQTGEIAASMRHLEGTVDRMAGDLAAVRAELSRVAAAVGAENLSPEGGRAEQKTEVVPQ
jgi:hypothetical protein